VDLAALSVGRRGPRVNEVAANDDETRCGTHACFGRHKIHKKQVQQQGKRMIIKNNISLS
jgi:hypothetical protein